MNAKPLYPDSAPAAPQSAKLHFKPRLNELLRRLRLDVSYERGQGDYLYYRDAAGREVQVLDLVGGYGSLLLGHAHPELVAVAQRLLASNRPFHAQGSRRNYAAELARRLSARAGGDYCVVFANSGAEAVEAGLKHAMLENGGRTFIALERGFHGKTLGALQLTANAQYRAPFALAGLEVLRVPVNDLERLEWAFARAKRLAGVLMEPILGEGGVWPMEPGFAQRAAQLCAERGVPLIADECQTGLGRTGSFLASHDLGVQPGYIILSKALGGGLAKISALLIERSRYRDEFDLQHTSTYAEDDFSCAIALKTLDLVDDASLAACREKGDQLLTGLRRLAAQYPEIIADVRGRGLMVGVEFKRRSQASSFLLRFLSAQEDLVCTIAGYLLNVHAIRVAPTLSDRFTLRLEPSALISPGEIRRFLSALEEVCLHLAADDALNLTRFLIEGNGDAEPQSMTVWTGGKPIIFDEPRFHERQRHVPATQVAWLGHLIDADNFISLEPGFAPMKLDERERYLGHLAPQGAPVLLSAVDVRSITGRALRFHAIVLPFTSRWVKAQLDRHRFVLPQALIQQGIDLAGSLGCQMVSLGQYTSIATLNGTRLKAQGLGVTSGNSYAVACALQAIERAQCEISQTASDCTLVVAGAAGNIGRTCAEVLAPRYRRTLLVGSPRRGSLQRLENLAQRLPRASATTDLRAAREGQVVVVAVNAVDSPMGADHFSAEAIVCDLSVPAGLQAGVAAARPDLFLIKGGIVSLPFGESLEIVDFPLPQGQAYACMAEAMLLGFEGLRDSTFTGALTADHLSRVANMARRHGFALADYKRSCVLGSEPREEFYATCD